MVTKLILTNIRTSIRSVLAKILMVTKQRGYPEVSPHGSVLAKILMVTKRNAYCLQSMRCSVLAKILMVTKPQKYGSTFLNVIEY